jgi:hypothetical protein
LDCGKNIERGGVKVFAGGFADFGCFFDGKSWWICGGLYGECGALAATNLGIKNTPGF